jgi:hypothetical protein
MLIDILLTLLSIVHTIVTRHGQSSKTPPAYEACTREASAAPAVRSVLGMLSNLEVKVLWPT